MKKTPPKTKAAATCPISKKKDHPAPTPLEYERLLHDLQVHQLELQTQNTELREAQQLLELSRDRYADLYEFAPVGFVTLNENGIIHQINLTAAEMLGMARGRLLGLPFHLHVLPDDLPRLRHHLQSFTRPQQTATSELRLIRRPVNTPVHVVLQSVRTFDEETKSYLYRTALTDITARREAEALLRNTEAVSHGILNSLDAHIAVLDPHGRVVKVNEAWNRFARENGDATLTHTGVGINYLKVCQTNLRRPDDDARKALEGIKTVLQGRLPRFQLEYPCHSPTENRWFLMAVTPLSGQTGGVVISHWNISERRRLEHRLRVQYEITRVLAEAPTIDIAFPNLLKTVAVELNWQVAEFWQLEEKSQNLIPAHIWHLPSKTLDAFVAHSRKLRANMFDGLPAQVLHAKQPEWITNISHCPHFARRHAAQRAGLQSALAFPILLENRMLGIIAFLSRQTNQPDPDLLLMFARLGSQIGQFIERKHAEEALRLSEINLSQAQHLAKLGGYEITLNGGGHVRWSSETYHILGLNPDSGALTPSAYLSNCVHPEDQTRVRNAFRIALEKCTDLDISYRIVRPDGSVRHVHNIVKPVLGQNRRTARLIGTLQDITHQRELERAILEISEREQRRIGQDLHDSLGQRLTALQFFSQSLISDLQQTAPHLALQAQTISRELRETISQARLLSHGLAPVPLDGEGLMRALKELAAGTTALSKIHCQFLCPSPVTLDDISTATHLYRIAQEAVQNALKHAHATRIRIRLLKKHKTLELTISDNGRGLPNFQSNPDMPPNTDGTGLRVMFYRASMIGAVLRTRSNPGKGLTITCHFPILEQRKID